MQFNWKSLWYLTVNMNVTMGKKPHLTCKMGKCLLSLQLHRETETSLKMSYYGFLFHFHVKWNVSLILCCVWRWRVHISRDITWREIFFELFCCFLHSLVYLLFTNTLSCHTLFLWIILPFQVKCEKYSDYFHIERFGQGFFCGGGGEHCGRGDGLRSTA